MVPTNEGWAIHHIALLITWPSSIARKVLQIQLQRSAADGAVSPADKGREMARYRRKVTLMRCYAVVLAVAIAAIIAHAVGCVHYAYSIFALAECATVLTQDIFAWGLAQDLSGWTLAVHTYGDMPSESETKGGLSLYPRHAAKRLRMLQILKAAYS